MANGRRNENNDEKKIAAEKKQKQNSNLSITKIVLLFLLLRFSFGAQDSGALYCVNTMHLNFELANN